MIRKGAEHLRQKRNQEGNFDAGDLGVTVYGTIENGLWNTSSVDWGDLGGNEAATQVVGGVGQPGDLESMIPVWGSGRAAIDHFQNGNYWRGLGYSALAISDVFLVKAIFTGIAKGGITALGKSYKNWGGSGWRKFYGKEGFAASGQHLHHWAWARNGQKSGKGFGWWAKNQMWNLMPMRSPALHQSVHGVGPNALGPMGKFWYGTPTWFKAGVASGGGRIIDEN